MSVGQMIIVKTLQAKLDRKHIHPPKKKTTKTLQKIFYSLQKVLKQIYTYISIGRNTQQIELVSRG